MSDSPPNRRGSLLFSITETFYWWSKSFLVDYVVGGMLIGISFAITKALPISYGEVIIDDVSISHPLRDESITMKSLMLIMGACALFAGLFFYAQRGDAFEDFHSGFLLFAFDALLCQIIHSLMKQTSGVPRPDFIPRCAPACLQNITWTCAPKSYDYNTHCENPECCPVMCGIADPRIGGKDVIPCTYLSNGVQYPNAKTAMQASCSKFVGTYADIDSLDCYGDPTKNDAYAIDNGFMSFPSGHAIFSVSWFFLLAFYIIGKTGLYKQTWEGRSIYTFILAFVGIAFSFWVSMSRIGDHKHSISDISYGMLIGLLIAVLLYPIYYPSMFSSENEGYPHRRVDFNIADILLCKVYSSNGKTLPTMQIRLINSDRGTQSTPTVNSQTKLISSAPLDLESTTFAEEIPHLSSKQEVRLLAA